MHHEPENKVNMSATADIHGAAYVSKHSYLWGYPREVAPGTIRSWQPKPFSALAEPQRRRRRAPSHRAVKQEVADAIRVQEKEGAQTTIDAVEDLFLSRGLKMAQSSSTSRRPTVKLLLFRRR